MSVSELQPGFNELLEFASLTPTYAGLKQQGLKVADAAHLALAEQVSDVLITVDDRFLKFCRRTNLTLWCATPPQFCEQENLR
ncbi:MAG: hypothetical protein BWK78_09060 [Thiotrichaceae bacterium IS1]|nr:MAG: hypothetical protein BWK78_09060 [Thiotrichaceae bacterium IS1]